MDGAQENGNMEKKNKALVIEAASKRTLAQIATLRGAVNR